MPGLASGYGWTGLWVILFSILSYLFCCVNIKTLRFVLSIYIFHCIGLFGYRRMPISFDASYPLYPTVHTHLVHYQYAKSSFPLYGGLGFPSIWWPIYGDAVASNRLVCSICSIPFPSLHQDLYPFLNFHLNVWTSKFVSVLSLYSWFILFVFNVFGLPSNLVAYLGL